ncbi:STAS domain-containing protein [Candidatus Methylospira mobilis]|uniref:STAS domain-containing protein n=1 Tax=Candidatus Methylospira mobilis TaxID=1808979 RepID=UPI0028E7C9A9|nr:STAS domain-containing protein [Candidatus Methylospira mobilis]WNV03484.1 STAS domain-containing protein [Candidatus Methylospira mobilis]
MATKNGVSDAGVFSIVERSPGVFFLVGDLTFETANSVLERTSGLLGATSGAKGMITLDLSGIKHADSAGLALMLEWRKQSSAVKRVVLFLNVPQQLQAIARVAGVDAIIHQST